MRNPRSDGPAQSARRHQRTPSARVENELLEAAEAVLRKAGLAGLTVRAVAAQAGIAPMAVYNRLGGKAGQLAALRIRGFARLRAALEAADERDASERLRACCLRYREFALGNPHFYAILFDGAGPPGPGSPDLDAHAEACLSVLARGAEPDAALRARPSPDARGTALQLWSAMHGAVAIELSGLLQAREPATRYEAVVQAVLRGQPGAR
jgi:AcrR family transcriptional regulator